MAPVRKRKIARSQAASAKASSVDEKPSIFGKSIDNTFGSNKKDKRIIKHSTFISRIEKSNIKKRRRPSKKLVTNLESLADALPKTDEAGSHDGELNTMIIKHKSLKSRPGAMKRKEKLERMEMDRFKKNLAQMAIEDSTVKIEPTATASTETQGAEAAMSNRWAALRGFISQTMEQKEEFRKG
ncbi:MAG: hypothetical protein M1834_006292 [Cirrosporium novae-zelandiae]|nr:MAG: hypothetical protein M1834_006292 [Cirrosporium novae-zelandiae]